jgi:hypothetical protein
MIRTKSEFTNIVSQYAGKFELLADKLHRLPHGTYNIKSVGACPHVMKPSFHYLCTIDGNIWRIDDINCGYVQNMVSLSLGGGIKPFPCVGSILPDGRIYVNDVRHIDDDKESMMMNDPNFAQNVVEEWLVGTSADPKMNAKKGRKKK